MATNPEETSNNDFLEMSDEDFLNSPMPEEETIDDTSIDEIEEIEVEDEPESTEEEEVDDTTESETDDDEKESDETDATEEAEIDTDTDEKSIDKVAEDAPKVDDKTVTDEVVDKPTESTVDYEAAYKQLTAPFKANGREMQVKSVEEAVTLMQMGANYNKKMAGLKPSLKILKMLENEGLLDEGKLSYLIDLDKKNPQAIQKFIKESGVDPLSIDTEEKNEYTPSTYSVDDAQLELDEVLSEIKDTPTYSRTINAISNQMDETSKRLLLSEPKSISLINSHMQSGIYDRIMDKVETERTFGRLKGLPDIEAYKQVGDALYNAGAFNDVIPQKVTTQKTAPVVIESSVPKSHTDEKLNDKKRAAAPAKRTVSKKPAVANDINPLAMSDADFEKMSATL